MINFAAKLLIPLAMLLLSGILLAAPAHALELNKSASDDQAKKIVLSFELSDGFESEAVYEYVKNLIVIKVKGLKLSSAQKRGTQLPGKGDTEQFYRHCLLREMEGGAEIVVVLGRLSNPGDAQVVPLDRKIVVEIVKPLWKLEEEAAAAAAADSPPADTPPADDPPADPAEDEAAGDALEGWSGDEGEAAETAGNGDVALQTTPETVGFIPDLSYQPERSYKQFDLTKVPVRNLEIRGKPFDEALIDLVSSTGFNVIAGSGIDDTEVNLNFTQRDVSLKSALDLLCIAYELRYTVEDDAIVFQLK